jgi:hypothetical protein
MGGLMDSTIPVFSPRSERKTGQGQSLIEFALLLPLLILIVFGTVDLGRAFFVSITLSNAAREGARYAVLNYTETDWVLKSRQRAADEGLGSGLALTIDNISVICPSTGTCSRGNPIKVTASYDFVLVMDFILPSPIALNRSVEMILP